MATRQQKIDNIRAEAEKIQQGISALKEKETLNAENLVNQPENIDLPEQPEAPAPDTPDVVLPEQEELEEKKGGVESEIERLENELISNADLRARESEELDIAGRRESLNESRKRFQKLQAQGRLIEANIRKEFEGTTTSERAISGMINKAKRENFAEVTQEQATFEILRGDLNTGLDLLDDVVNAVVQPLEFELETRRKQLTAIEDSLQPFEKAELDEAKAALKKEENELKEKKDEVSEIRKLGMSLVEAGAPQSVRRQVFAYADIENLDYDAAVELAAPYLVKKTSGGGETPSEKYGKKVMSAADRNAMNKEALAEGIGNVAHVGDTFNEAEERKARIAAGLGMPLSDSDPRITGDQSSGETFKRVDNDLRQKVVIAFGGTQDFSDYADKAGVSVGSLFDLFEKNRRKNPNAEINLFIKAMKKMLDESYEIDNDDND